MLTLVKCPKCEQLEEKNTNFPKALKLVICKKCSRKEVKIIRTKGGKITKMWYN